MLSSPPPFFFFNDTATTEIYTLSLHDALPILGILAALNRVYINIGVYSEEWTRHFNPFFGGKPITPVEIARSEEHTSELQSRQYLVCRLLLEKKKTRKRSKRRRYATQTRNTSP